jgi:hypothetical protein
MELANSWPGLLARLEVALEVVRGALRLESAPSRWSPAGASSDQALSNSQGGSPAAVLNDVVDASRRREGVRRQFVRTMVAIGENIGMLVAVLEAVGMLDTVIFELMNLLNGFRSRSRGGRRLPVFEDTIDFDQVHIATDSDDSIIFGIQDFHRIRIRVRHRESDQLRRRRRTDRRFTLVHDDARSRTKMWPICSTPHSVRSRWAMPPQLRLHAGGIGCEHHNSGRQVWQRPVTAARGERWRRAIAVLNAKTGSQSWISRPSSRAN